MELTHRNTLYWLLAILAVILLIWSIPTDRFSFHSPFASAAPQTTAERSSAPESAPAPTAAPQKPTIPLEQRRNQIQSEIDNLNSRLEQERSDLQTQQEILSNLQAQRDQLQEQISVQIPAQVNRNQTQIDNLLDSMDAQRAAERDLANTTETALKQQALAAQTERERIDLQISTLESNLQSSRSELSNIPSVAFDLDARETQVTALNNAISNQTQQLETLRAQRLAISETMLNQTRSLNAIAENQRNSLMETQNSMQQQVATLREETTMLQNRLMEAKMNLTNLEAQISQAQRLTERQSQDVADLENTLRLNFDNLQKLSSR